jgi:hypothetical protein
MLRVKGQMEEDAKQEIILKEQIKKLNLDLYSYNLPMLLKQPPDQQETIQEPSQLSIAKTDQSPSPEAEGKREKRKRKKREKAQEKQETEE